MPAQHLRWPDYSRRHGADAELQDHRRYGIGVDTIDLDAATEAGIIVTNNPTYCVEEVAEHTVAMLLTWRARSRSTTAWSAPVAGKFRPANRCSESAGSTCRSGRLRQHRAASREGGCGSRHARALLPTRSSSRASSMRRETKSSFDQLLAESDYICIHAPLFRRRAE